MPAQLTLAQRAILAELLKQNCAKREIACRLGVHRSTVYRELKRNTGPIGYLYQEAQQRTDIRRQLRRRARKLEDARVREFVCRELQNRWSPDQIVGRSRREFSRSPSASSGIKPLTSGAIVRGRTAHAGASFCGLVVRGEDDRKILVDCPMPCRSKDVPRWSIAARVSAIGKGIRW